LYHCAIDVNECRRAGSYTAFLKVTDSQGYQAQQSAGVTVLQRPNELPFQESFEPYTPGESLLGLRGWESGDATVALTNYTAYYRGESYPPPRATTAWWWSDPGRYRHVRDPPSCVVLSRRV
jgi:hypothetical protein